MPTQLSRRDARRVAVRAQLLDSPRPKDVLQVVRRLTLLQVDLTRHVEHNADLVLWSRLGAAYDRDELERLRVDGDLVELQMMLRPAEDLALFRADMRAWPGPEPLREWQRDVRDWYDANHGCREDILTELRSEGPLPAQALPDTCAVPWRSSGWTNDKNVMKLLELMEARGEVAVAGREGRERTWDLAERLHPDTDALSAEEAHAERRRRRLVALGIARARAPQQPNEPFSVGDAGIEAVVEGVPGTWRVDPAQLDGLAEPFRGRVALLSPLDRMVMDRKRVEELFGFAYQLEMYKPAAQRRWGYWALPVLSGDSFVGKLDVHADREAGVLRVEALHEDVALSRTTRTAIEREIRSLARWVDLVPEGLPTG